MKLIDFFVIDACIPELKATDRNGVIREMIARENHGSTGFGKGVAVPHVKHPSVKKMAASIARSTVGIDFAALDRAPVYTVVMLLSNDQDPDKHLAAMERIFRHLQRDNFRRFLRQAETQDAMRDLIVEADEMQEN